MKKLLAAFAISLTCLTSCVFDAPFATKAEFPVDEALLGIWQELPSPADRTPNRMLVMKNGANDYVVHYPAGADAMIFRAFKVELGGKRYFQIQSIGSAKGPAKDDERKYNLFLLEHGADSLSIRAINAKLLGNGPMKTEAVKAAFLKRQDDANLFESPVKFERVK